MYVCVYVCLFVLFCFVLFCFVWLVGWLFCFVLFGLVGWLFVCLFVCACVYVSNVM